MTGVRSGRGALIAVDGVDAAAVSAAATRALKTHPRGGISRWDASGVFQELAVADSAAGAPSPRTLILLYAADLAFRLRWQIRPAMAEGRTVVAAPYVDTATAFGRAAGLPPSWLMNLFRFAPRPADTIIVHAAARSAPQTEGFVGFSCDRMAGPGGTRTRRDVVEGMARELRRRDGRRRRGR
jgi:thymidylate kinase